MNLYTTSDNTRACVSALDDYLLGRTIVEAAQMISTAINLNDKIKEKPEGLYSNYNANEEHNVWVRESKYNFKWTFMYLLDALNEFINTNWNSIIKILNEDRKIDEQPLLDENLPMPDYTQLL